MIRNASWNQAICALLVVVAVIFGAELAIMVGFEYLNLKVGAWVNLVDSLSLSLIVYPIVYFAVFLPLMEKNRSLEAAEQALLSDQSKLEKRIVDRTAEISLTNEKLSESLVAIRSQQHEMSALAEMTQLLQACDVIEETCLVARKQLHQLLPGSSGALYLMNHSQNTLKRALEWGVEGRFDETFAPQSCWALRCCRPLEVRSGQDAVFCTHANTAPEGHHYCLPLMAHGEALGTLCLHTTSGHQHSFSHRESDETNRMAFYTAIAKILSLDISNTQLRETLRYQALRDSITGLFNRRYMFEALQREIDRSAFSSSPTSIILFDIDHFKKFNDVAGHDAGDAIIVAIGNLMKRWAQPSEIVARYDGEEFMIVLPDATLQQAMERAEDIRRAIEALTVIHLNQRLGLVTISAGVSTFPNNGGNRADLIKSADEALYQAKRSGRNRVTSAGSKLVGEDRRHG